ncbi:hypothetical protein QTH97_34755 [Variovorax sp. J22R24]|uniref:hypothetical protein n=1 Tax=Variovorax gracilis TaxID=3053502 RepID=UPI0025783809|nr:hypothetical protein [Variovorax sp. J22R24]MDM0110104.1 hypothetical protein [Variovorax sp. J22R24]
MGAVSVPSDLLRRRALMSLTESQAVFASVHETAINDFLTAFCRARPRYLNYGSPAFTPVTTVAETRMDAIAFPGVAGGIQWRLRLSIPKIDLFKQTDPLPPELVLGPGQFSAEIDAELCIECRKIRIDPKPPRPPRGKDNPNEPPHDGRQHPIAELTCFRLRVFAIGHLEQVVTTTGEDAIAFAVDLIEIVDIQPPELESFLECLLFMILQAVLAGIRLPLDALRADAFPLALTVGPLIEDDQIKARGTL